MRREKIGYLLAVLMDMCMMGTIFFSVTRRAADGGEDAMRLGCLAGVVFLVYGTMSPIFGRLADRFGRRRFMTVGMIGTGLLVWLCAWETRYTWLVVLSGGTGLTTAMFWPALISWFSECRRGVALVRVLSVYCISWNVGLSLGSFGGGALYEFAPWVTFACYGSLLFLGPLLLLVPAWKKENDKDDAQVPHGHDAMYFVRAAWLANLMVLIGLGGVQAMFPQLAIHLDIGPALHGQMLAASRAASVAAFLLMWWSHSWQHRTWPLLAGYLLCFGGSLTFFYATDPMWFFLGFTALGFASGATYLASIYYVMEAFEGKAAGAGWSELVLGAGMFLGPVLAGYVGYGSGLRSPYAFIALLFLGGLLAQLMLRRTRRRPILI